MRGEQVRAVRWLGGKGEAVRLAEVWVDNEYPGEELGLVDRRLQLVSWLSSPATLAGRISARRLPACWRLASSSGLTMLRLTMLRLAPSSLAC